MEFAKFNQKSFDYTYFVLFENTAYIGELSSKV